MQDQISTELEGEKFCINKPPFDGFNLFQRDIKIDWEYFTFVLPQKKEKQFKPTLSLQAMWALSSFSN